MTGTSDGLGPLWGAVLERFEQQAPASVMARTLLEQAFPAPWLDAVFAQHRGRQYERTLLFSTVVELMMRVAVGLQPSLHAAARQAEPLPVSLTALYDKLKRTDPDLLGALVRASAERLGPVLPALGPSPVRLPGYAIRILDGNHLPASQKRLKALRGVRGAALPGLAMVVYDPDSGLVTDLVAGEDAYQHERALAAPLLERAGPGQVWIGDRHFCPGALLRGWAAAGASFVVREHANHPRLRDAGDWHAAGRTETGRLREQTITLDPPQEHPPQEPPPQEHLPQEPSGPEQAVPWRRIELTLAQPTQAGDRVLRLWSNLPATVTAAQIAQAYRDRWRIEGMFQRLEGVLRSEIPSLGHPRAALLGFSVALLAYNVLALIERCVERAHAPDAGAAPKVSLYHLVLQIRSGYDGLCIALPPEHWAACGPIDPPALAARLLSLARRIDPARVRAGRRKPKDRTAKSGPTSG
ncbi:IS4 family transposase, partial [Methylobacterium sp. NEAU 140]|uniref:IS4 family transposase n=1 Tax=Methylobacterium sp. NEAU 140 TaxID=3064945 RepID=UPI002734D410